MDYCQLVFHMLGSRYEEAREEPHDLFSLGGATASEDVLNYYSVRAPLPAALTVAGDAGSPPRSQVGLSCSLAPPQLALPALHSLAPCVCSRCQEEVRVGWCWHRTAALPTSSRPTTHSPVGSGARVATACSRRPRRSPS